MAGATVHLVTPTLDHGPILAQAVVPVRPDDTPDTLAARVLLAEHRLYPQVVRWFVEDGVIRQHDQVLPPPGAPRVLVDGQWLA